MGNINKGFGVNYVNPEGGGASYSFSNGLTLDGTSVKGGGTIIENTVFAFDPTAFFVGFGDIANGIGVAFGNVGEDGLFVDVGYGFDRFQRVTLKDGKSYNLDINPAAQSIEFSILEEGVSNYGLNIFDNGGKKTANMYFGERIETSPGVYATLDTTRVEANSEEAHIWAKASTVPEESFAHSVKVNAAGIMAVFGSEDGGLTNGLVVKVDAGGLTIYNAASPSPVLFNIPATGVGIYADDAAAATALVPVNGMYQETAGTFLKLRRT